MIATFGERLRENKYIRDLLTFPGDAAVAWRHQGVSGVAAELRKRTLDRVLRRSRSLVIEQLLDDVAEVPPPPGIQIRAFSGPDWSPLTAIASRATLNRFRRDVNAGRICLVAWRGDRPVGYTWISREMDRGMEFYPLPLPRDAAYGWDLFVVSEERSSGVGSALVSARLRYTRELGFRSMWRVIDRDNPASRRTLAKTTGIGTRIVGELKSLRILHFRWASFHTGNSTSEPATAHGG
ncbi:hypothetical protein BH23GEM4_BH23GEM4_01380 [soil metagenome]